MVGGSPPPSRKCAAARERTPLTTSDGSPQWSRATVTDGEGPAVMVSDVFRLRASDGSQPQSRMKVTDG